MTARARRGGLLRQRDFRRLWLADVFSQLGARISVFGVPLLATNTLGASTFEVSALRTAQTAAYLLVGLQAGAWCDRIRTRPVLISTDLARAGVLASVPVAAAFGVLTVWQLLAVVFVAGLGTVFFDVAHQTYLPRLVSRQEVVEGTAKLQANTSVAAVAAPAATGYLANGSVVPLRSSQTRWDISGLLPGCAASGARNGHPSRRRTDSDCATKSARAPGWYVGTQSCGRWAPVVPCSACVSPCTSLLLWCSWFVSYTYHPVRWGC